MGKAGILAGEELGVFGLAAGTPGGLLLLEGFPLLLFFFGVFQRLKLELDGGVFGRTRGLLHGGATVRIVAGIGGGGRMGRGRGSRSGGLWCVVRRMLLLRWIVILIVVGVVPGVAVGWCVF